MRKAERRSVESFRASPVQDYYLLLSKMTADVAKALGSVSLTSNPYKHWKKHNKGMVGNAHRRRQVQCGGNDIERTGQVRLCTPLNSNFEAVDGKVDPEYQPAWSKQSLQQVC